MAKKMIFIVNTNKGKYDDIEHVTLGVFDKEELANACKNSYETETYPALMRNGNRDEFEDTAYIEPCPLNQNLPLV